MPSFSSRSLSAHLTIFYFSNKGQYRMAELGLLAIESRRRRWGIGGEDIAPDDVP
jgi:hypothetical protein